LPIGYPAGGDNGGNTINTGWIGNSITSDWATTRNRTNVSGSKPGSRSTTGTGGVKVDGPKKKAEETPSRLLEQKTASQSRTDQAVKKTATRQSVTTRSSQTGSRVKRYYTSERQGVNYRSASNVNQTRTKGASSVSENSGTRRRYTTTKATSYTQPSRASSTRNNKYTSRKQPTNYYKSGTTKSSSRYNATSRSSNSNSGYRSYTSPSKSTKSNSYRSSSSSMRSSGGGSFGGSRGSGGGVRSSGGGRR
jgi:hypothetical protein